MVDDNMIKTDKIGSSNYFWAFPGDECVGVRQSKDCSFILLQRKNQIKKLETELEGGKRKRESLQAEKAAAMKGRPDTVRFCFESD
jgi:hypothetical protein